MNRNVIALAVAGAHNAVVQMIDMSIARAHQHGAMALRNRSNSPRPWGVPRPQTRLPIINYPERTVTRTGSHNPRGDASERRVRSLMPWRRAGVARADAELRHRVAVAEEQLADLKTALDDMRAQRDAWQAMAHARIRPAPSGTSRWPWLRSAG
jgi:hypothetical protein